MQENQQDTSGTVDVLLPTVDAALAKVDKLFSEVDVLLPEVDKLLPAVDVLSDNADKFNKQFVLKPSATIAIEGAISAPARKLFNVLYAHAFDNIQATKHVIALPTIMSAMDGTLANYERLRDHLGELAKTLLKWNILEKDGRVWGVASLLSSAEIHEDLNELRYTLAQQLREEERIMPYAKISISKQNHINSNHALTLYEILTDYYSERYGKGETPWIPLALYQRLLGTAYTEWRDIQKRLIREPLGRLKDLDFTVKAETKKRGRKVVAVKFTMKRASKEPAQAKPPKSVQEAIKKLSKAERHSVNMEVLRRLEINPSQEQINAMFIQIVKEKYLKNQ